MDVEDWFWDEAAFLQRHKINLTNKVLWAGAGNTVVQPMRERTLIEKKNFTVYLSCQKNHMNSRIGWKDWFWDEAAFLQRHKINLTNKVLWAGAGNTVVQPMRERTLIEKKNFTVYLSCQKNHMNSRIGWTTVLPAPAQRTLFVIFSFVSLQKSCFIPKSIFYSHSITSRIPYSAVFKKK